METETQWFYSADKQRFGPKSKADLLAAVAQGKVNPLEAVVWHQGLRDWVAWLDMDDLRSDTLAVMRQHKALEPPPLPICTDPRPSQQLSASRPVSTSTRKTAGKFGFFSWSKRYTRQELLHTSRWLLVFLAIAAIGTGVVTALSAHTNDAIWFGRGIVFAGAIYALGAVLPFFWFRFICLSVWLFDLLYSNTVAGAAHPVSIGVFVLGTVFLYKMWKYRNVDSPLDAATHGFSSASALTIVLVVLIVVGLGTSLYALQRPAANFQSDTVVSDTSTSNQPTNAVALNARDARSSFFAELDRLSPGWRKLNVDMGFFGWLDEVDPRTESKRVVRFNAIVRQKNATEVAAYFNEFERTQAARDTVKTINITRQDESCRAAFAAKYGAGHAFTPRPEGGPFSETIPGEIWRSPGTKFCYVTDSKTCLAASAPFRHAGKWFAKEWTLRYDVKADDSLADRWASECVLDRQEKVLSVRTGHELHRENEAWKRRVGEGMDLSQLADRCGQAITRKYGNLGLALKRKERSDGSMSVPFRVYGQQDYAEVLDVTDRPRDNVYATIEFTDRNDAHNRYSYSCGFYLPTQNISDVGRVPNDFGEFLESLSKGGR